MFMTHVLQQLRKPFREFYASNCIKNLLSGNVRAWPEDSLLNCVPCVIKTCSRTNVPSVLMCNFPCVLMCSRASVPCVLTCSRTNVLCVLTCSLVSMHYVLTWLTSQHDLRAYVHTCERSLQAHMVTC